MGFRSPDRRLAISGLAAFFSLHFPATSSLRMGCDRNSDRAMQVSPVLAA
jgi:hypothetical protein